MSVQEPRRSGRVRTQVKSYADEQAGDVAKANSSKRKRVTAQEEEAAPKKKSSKKRKHGEKSTDADETAATSEKATEPAKASSSKPTRTATNSSWHGDAAERRIKANNRNVRKLAPGQEERRLRGYVDEPPQAYRNALKKANTQKMFILDRERGVEDSCHASHSDCPCETVQIAGSTGNVYTITISHLPSCTCPVGVFTNKGKERLCKHAIYVLHNVLKAPDRLKQQNAFLTSELKEIFANAPALPGQVAEDEPMDGNRKPMEDDCPICCMEFEDGEEVVWCRAACGNNVHKACFDQWAQTKMGSKITCPFCRTEWEYEEAKKQKVNVASIYIPEKKIGGGYRNVRDQLNYDEQVVHDVSGASRQIC